MINDVLQRMRNALAITDPEWDIAVGTPEYKILEAVAAEITGAYANGMLQDYHFDIDTKTGVALDRFCALFGIVRLAGTRATGTITLARGTAATSDIDIASGTEVVKAASAGAPAVYFTTTSDATIATGLSSVEIPIEARVAGTSGNVVAGAISLLGTSTAGGITSVSNANPTSGGTELESDAALRLRWKSTVFRNLAGTEDHFLAIALEDPAISKAVVIGPVERHTEQLEIASGAATSGITDAKYIFPAGGEFLGFNLGSLDETIAIRGSDYAYAASNPPVFTILDSVEYPDGEVVDVDFEYTPTASRNDPSTGVLHNIDIFVQGQNARSVIEEFLFQTGTGFTFNTTSGDPMERTNWLREDETTPPTSGNRFTALQSQPIIEIPDSMTIGATTYLKGTHYWKVRDVTSLRGSPRGKDGIEWLAAGAPINGTAVVLAYDYNAAIGAAHDAVNDVRLVGSDALVHEARKVYLRFHLSVVLNAGYSPSTESNNVADAIGAWLGSKGFRDNVQISDMIDTVKGVASVDNVRLTKSTEDSSDYNIKRIAEDGTTVLSTHNSDIYLKADEIPVLESVIMTVRGVNTF